MFISSDLIPLGCGIDANDLLLKLVSGKETAPDQLTVNETGSGYLCFCLPEGTIRRVRGREEVLNIPGVHKAFLDSLEAGSAVKKMTDKTHTLEKEAYEKGFAQGERAGQELGEKRFDSTIKSFTEAADDLFGLQKKVYQESEQHLVELVLAVARQVIQKEVETDRHILLDIIQSAFRYVADREAITVRLHPSDLEFANQHKTEVIQKIEGLGKLAFEGDEKVSRGDALIESRLGMVECGIEKHLKELEETLRTQAEKKVPAVKEQEGDEPRNDS